MKFIEKKILPGWFEQIVKDNKNFEIRIIDNENDFIPGNVVVLKEYLNKYTGRIQLVQIKEVWTCLPGLKDDYCIFTFNRIGGVITNI